MFCDDCLTAAYDELGGQSTRSEQEFLLREAGEILPDHLCEETAGEGVRCECPCHRTRHVFDGKIRLSRPAEIASNA